MRNISMKTVCIGFLITLAVNGLVLAQDHLEEFVTAQNRFEHGLRGSKSDNERAAEQFKSLSEQEQGNPLFLAYYGSTFTIRSRDAFMPWNKLKLGEQGLDIIDKALRMLAPEHDKVMMRGVPVSLETRLVAVSTFLKVPDKYFHRFDAGRSLLTETMKSRLFQVAPPQIQARFHFQAASVAQKEQKNAEEACQLKRVLELDPQGRDADAARARLKELGL
ncbi:hypothetical protein [Geotalea uraniireducens]|uniref:Uncharacterized protein n=1 Tax=Geotalea uraniireducens (strain Rf4) TaxID=351605 RepID=A5G497_GEOUR|nr:hypothetical protein [Geotalea uraniireducens]ABQ26615.1 hypothetical protein Gura_2436 [Geotalea uraniireducens Rf4]